MLKSKFWRYVEANGRKEQENNDPIGATERGECVESVVEEVEKKAKNVFKFREVDNWLRSKLSLIRRISIKATPPKNSIIFQAPSLLASPSPMLLPHSFFTNNFNNFTPTNFFIKSTVITFCLRLGTQARCFAFSIITNFLSVLMYITLPEHDISLSLT